MAAQALGFSQVRPDKPVIYTEAFSTTAVADLQ
jgi:hypothetical protein